MRAMKKEISDFNKIFTQNMKKNMQKAEVIIIKF